MKIVLNPTEEQLEHLKKYFIKTQELLGIEASGIADLAVQVGKRGGLDKISEELDAVAVEYQDWIAAAKMAEEELYKVPLMPVEGNQEAPPNKKAKKIDQGKVVALHEAGWPIKKIADEMQCTDKAVYYILGKYGKKDKENTAT